MVPTRRELGRAWAGTRCLKVFWKRGQGREYQASPPPRALPSPSWCCLGPRVWLFRVCFPSQVCSPRETTKYVPRASEPMGAGSPPVSGNPGCVAFGYSLTLSGPQRPHPERGFGKPALWDCWSSARGGHREGPTPCGRAAPGPLPFTLLQGMTPGKGPPFCSRAPALPSEPMEGDPETPLPAASAAGGREQAGEAAPGPRRSPHGGLVHQVLSSAVVLHVGEVGGEHGVKGEDLLLDGAAVRHLQGSTKEPGDAQPGGGWAPEALGRGGSPGRTLCRGMP